MIPEENIRPSVPFKEKEDNVILKTEEAETSTSTEKIIPEAVSYLPDRYEYISLLGEGGMGAVFKVRDRELNTIFALKMLRPQLMLDADALRRFNHEARSAKELDHPNISTVYEYGSGKLGAPYLVMEYLEGKSLDTILLEENRLSVPRAIGLSSQIADALSYAHGEGIVHRDVKPSNIVVNKAADGTEIVKLVDFGIAKTVMNDDHNLTKTGDVIGSPCYMSPEQCEGPRVGPQADIYSLGCVLYEMLCGKPPFVGENSVQTVLKHMREAPLPLASLFDERGIPQSLNDITLHCLRKDPLKRYQTAAEVKKDLDACNADQKAKPSFQKQELKIEGSQFFKRRDHRPAPFEIIVVMSIAAAFALFFTWRMQVQDEEQMAYKATFLADELKGAIKQSWYLSRVYKGKAQTAEQAQILKILAAYGPAEESVKAKEAIAKLSAPGQ